MCPSQYVLVQTPILSNLPVTHSCQTVSLKEILVTTNITVLQAELQ